MSILSAKNQHHAYKCLKLSKLYNHNKLKQLKSGDDYCHLATIPGATDEPDFKDTT
jgi:hypothetical protein